MATRQRAWGLPLLAKELVEQAARKRTYVVRSVYAGLLFFSVLLMFWDVVYENLQNPFSVLGRGREMFEMLVGLQTAGIYLFLPALACGVITMEKERNSLGLLFLTKLGPWAIILEKYLARLIPMLSFLLLSLPVLAFCYSLGGVNPGDIWTASWLLLLTTLQVGAFAVMCSCLFRTTVAAFVGTYVLGALFYFTLPIVFVMIDPRTQSLRLFSETLRELLLAGDPLNSRRLLGPEHVIFPWLPVVQFFEQWDAPWWLSALKSIPTLLSIAALLGMARRLLVRRAFVTPKNYVLNFFRGLDGIFQRWNERWTKGIVVYNEMTTLPEDQPVAWRETKKRSLGTVRYLVRVFLVLEVPVLLICLMIAFIAGGSYDSIEAFAVVMCTLWVLSVLLVAVKGTSLIAGERTHETLDVLLTTPLSSRELMTQKMQGMRRLLAVLAVPFATMILFETSWRGEVHTPWRRDDNPVLYVISASLAVVLYLPIVAWLSCYIGLRMKTQARAIFAAVAAVALWCIGPFLIAIPFLVTLHGSGEEPFEFLLGLSPAVMICLTEVGELDDIASEPIIAIVFNFMLYAFALSWLRNKCLLNASRFLGRAEPA